MSDHRRIFYPELQLSLGENLIYDLEEASSLASSFLTMSPQSSKKRKMGEGLMKTWKLVSGILSILLFVMISFESCSIILAMEMMEMEDSAGYFGLLMSAFLLASGIVSIISRKGGEALQIALIALFLLALVSGALAFRNFFGDMILWCVWCLINLILAVISFRTEGKKSMIHEAQVSDDILNYCDLDTADDGYEDREFKKDITTLAEHMEERGRTKP